MVCPASSIGLRDSTQEVLIEKIRRGLNYRTLARLAQAIGVRERELASKLGISVRTLPRRKASGLLSPRESDRLVRLAFLFEDAIRLFEGDVAEAADWFTAPQRALGGISPLDYADTEPGVQEVRNLIGRLGEGVFS